MVSISHGFRSVRLAADFATPVAMILDPVGVTKEPPILSRAPRQASRGLKPAARGSRWARKCDQVAGPRRGTLTCQAPYFCSRPASRRHPREGGD